MTDANKTRIWVAVITASGVIIGALIAAFLSREAPRHDLRDWVRVEADLRELEVNLDVVTRARDEAEDALTCIIREGPDSTAERA